MMDSRITSLSGLATSAVDGAPAIDRIEIPLIQRDYAQGRTDATTTTIRANFLDVVHDAATGGEKVGLDFVYGEVHDGTMLPLDGQQRLTTLFLLHWYVASRTDNLDSGAGWAKLTYATRPGARRFCERLVRNALPSGGVAPSDWIRDQPWHLYVWGHDPTVQSMLVMLDEIHDRFAAEDLAEVWQRLVDPDDPAISFHLLPIDDMGSAEDLYIKMNSRGRPLTDFEIFKAHLDKAVERSDRAAELAIRLDGRWADVMWALQEGDGQFDRQYLNYVRYILDLCEWRRGVAGTAGRDDVTRAERELTPRSDGSEDGLDLLFAAFDAWIDDDDAPVDSEQVFASILSQSSSPEGQPHDTQPVVVFGDIAINLFAACCRTRPFQNRSALLLYAVLLHRMHGSEDLLRRIRVVRNLIEASTNEIRSGAMPRLIADVERIVLEGRLDEIDAFNTSQGKDEVIKRDFLASHPELERELFLLEDDEITRGCLMAFEYEADSFVHRAEAFRRVFAVPGLALTGALLACGDYSRPLNATKRQFGPPTAGTRWRDLLAGAAPSRPRLAKTREVLVDLLDRIDLDGPAINEQLSTITEEWLATCEETGCYDWRYYLVKYPAMRAGRSGVYATATGPPRFMLCMLEGTALNGYYRDPYLLAIARASGRQRLVQGSIENRPDGPWFTGPASSYRWMRLVNSGAAMRCDPRGFVLRPPAVVDHRATFEMVCADHQVSADGGEYRLSIPHEELLGTRCDEYDRVQAGADLLRALADAGL